MVSLQALDCVFVFLIHLWAIMCSSRCLDTTFSFLIPTFVWYLAPSIMILCFHIILYKFIKPPIHQWIYTYSRNFLYAKIFLYSNDILCALIFGYAGKDSNLHIAANIFDNWVGYILNVTDTQTYTLTVYNVL